MNHTRKMLDLSTSHITADDGALLITLHHGGVEAFRERTGTGPRPCYGAHEYGGVFWCGDEEDDAPAWSRALVDVLRYARGSGHDFVLFDADAPVHDDLKTFHW